MRHNDAHLNCIHTKVMHIKSLIAQEQLIALVLIYQNYLVLRLLR